MVVMQRLPRRAPSRTHRWRGRQLVGVIHLPQKTQAVTFRQYGLRKLQRNCRLCTIRWLKFHHSKRIYLAHKITALELANVEINRVFGDVRIDFGDRVDGIFDIKDPFLVKVGEHDLTVFTLLKCYDRITSDANSASVQPTSTEEAKLTAELLPAFPAE